MSGIIFGKMITLFKNSVNGISFGKQGQLQKYAQCCAYCGGKMYDQHKGLPSYVGSVLNMSGDKLKKHLTIIHEHSTKKARKVLEILMEENERNKKKKGKDIVKEICENAKVQVENGITIFRFLRINKDKSPLEFMSKLSDGLIKTLEHVQLHSQDGSRAPGNSLFAHKFCNHERDNNLLTMWINPQRAKNISKSLRQIRYNTKNTNDEKLAIDATETLSEKIQKETGQQLKITG